jgi:hypothetical protein
MLTSMVLMLTPGPRWAAASMAVMFAALAA